MAQNLQCLDLGLIGNGHVSALVDPDGAIVWYCTPRLDGDPIFCSLLDGDPAERRLEGSFAIELEGCVDTHQSYLENTAILRTVQRDAQGGALEILDFCPRFRQGGRSFHPSAFVRLIRPLGGDPRVRIRVRPRRDWGAAPCETTHGSNHIRYVGSPGGVLRLTTNAPITSILEGRPFILNRPVALVAGEDRQLAEAPLTVAQDFLRRTRGWWQDWTRTLAVPFEWQDEVIRAAITLKLSCFEDTGAIIAAPTTSIPEAADSSRNWDYRFCWLRDSVFVVRALNRLGATSTMEGLLSYLNNLIAGVGGEVPELQPVYGINWEADLVEREIDTLRGFRGIGPVRVGNDAYRQVQHDVYGGVVLALSQLVYDRRILSVDPEALLPRLEEAGRLARRFFGAPDAGIWEFRGSARPHTHSSLMCWVACDRLARVYRHLGRAADAERWGTEAVRMRDTLVDEAWSDELQSFTASFGGDTLDASVLLMFELGFLPPDHPKMLATLDAVEAELLRDGFVYRYTEEDDFGAPDNAFLVCTFWFVDALAMAGRVEDARRIFERLLSARTRLGLMAEHIDPATGELWGNFPQTYSMAGIINCALRLSRSWEGAV
ncbi:glycoside hydrolase family 15 protein [Gaopeijia maritima]|uniref:glycoside hydrolase family 15 protein n=1 Tax=Gaopeijia maritima TaxID=3119007 RepID=UPI003294171A